MILLIAILCMYIYNTAKPIDLFKNYITNKVNNQYFTELIHCTKCASFWIAPLLYVIIPVMPKVLIFMIILTSTITFIEWIYLKYFE